MYCCFGISQKKLKSKNKRLIKSNSENNILQTQSIVKHQQIILTIPQDFKQNYDGDYLQCMEQMNDLQTKNTHHNLNVNFVNSNLQEMIQCEKITEALKQKNFQTRAIYSQLSKYQKHNIIEDQPQQQYQQLIEQRQLVQQINRTEQFSKLMIKRDLINAKQLFLTMSPQQKNRCDSKGVPPIFMMTMHSIKDQYFLCMTKDLIYDREIKLKTKGPLGWNSLQQAIYYRNIPLIVHLFKSCYLKRRSQFCQKMQIMFEILQKLPDFQIQIHVKIDSFLPLIDKFAPNDILKITKYKNSLRLDSTLVGYQNLSCKRRNMSLIFNPKNAKKNSKILKEFPLVLLNHSKNTYTNILQELCEQQLKLVIKDLMNSETINMQPTINKIQVKQSYNIFNNKIEQQLNGYSTEKYNIKIDYDSRTQKRKFESKKNQNLYEYLDDWETYQNYNFEKFKKKKKNKMLELDFWITKNYPLQFKQILDIVKILSSGNLFLTKINDFFGDQKILQQTFNGFPIKIQVPYNYTLYLEIQFRNVKFLNETSNQTTNLFQIPKDFEYLERKLAQKTLIRQNKRLLLANFYI